jgi:putative DNA primase/helicase
VAPDGSGKAPVDRPRLYWPGLTKKGVVRLWPDEEVTLGLCVAEGIETALTAAAGFGLAWACLDAGNLAALPVLPGIESLTIIADHDQAGIKAADECQSRWLEAGVEVRMWMAPAEGDDFNSYIGEAS